MKKIGLGIVLGAFGITKSLNNLKDDGATISINWSNNKGEKKLFKIDDIERQNGNQKILSKTLLQKFIRTSRKKPSWSCCRSNPYSKCYRRCEHESGDASCVRPVCGNCVRSGDVSCVRTGDANYVRTGDANCVRTGDANCVRSGDANCVRSGDASLERSGYVSRGRSGDASIVRSGDVSRGRSGDASIVRSGNVSLRRSSDAIRCRSGDASLGRPGYTTYSRPGYANYGYGDRDTIYGRPGVATYGYRDGDTIIGRPGVASYGYGSRDASYGYGSRDAIYVKSVDKRCNYDSCNDCSVEKYKQPILITHRPVYGNKQCYKPICPTGRKVCVNNMRRENSCEDCYNKDYDKKEEKLSLNELSKLLKLKKDNHCKYNNQQKCANKYRKQNSMSKYLNKKDSNYVKDNCERCSSNEKKKNYKYTNSGKLNKQKNNHAQNSHQNEMKKSHNIINLNHKANEKLCMKEKDKDNLHCNDKIIEEFDKLEHYKHVEENCRSASKARHANVNKNECLDKEQRQKNGEYNKELRCNHKSKNNLNKCCDNFDHKEKSDHKRSNRFLKDENELDCNREKEKEFVANCCKEKENANSNDLHKSKDDCCDYLNCLSKKDKCAENCCVDDDVNCKRCKRNTSNCACNLQRWTRTSSR